MVFQPHSVLASWLVRDEIAHFVDSLLHELVIKTVPKMSPRSLCPRLRGITAQNKAVGRLQNIRGVHFFL